MSTTADTTRRLAKLYQGEPCWNWATLNVGHVQPRGYRNYWHNRHQFQIHVTPVHLSRWGDVREFGVCLGKRTLFVLRHR